MPAKVVVHFHNTRGTKDRDPSKSEEMGDPVSEQVSSGEVEPDVGASEDGITDKARTALDKLIDEYGEGVIGALLAEYGVSKNWGEKGVGSSVGLTKNGNFVKVAAGTEPSTAKDAAPRKCKCGAHKK